MTPDYLSYLWAQIRQAFAKRAKPPHAIPQHVLRLIKVHVPQTGKVLCLGARNRQEPDFWRSEGYADVTAVDLLPSRGVRVADIHHLPFADATFALVVASHVLEHAYDPTLALKEICRTLRSGGLLWAAWPRGFVPNQHDRIDYGSASAFHVYVSHFCPMELLWRDDAATESRVLLMVPQSISLHV